MAQNENVEHIFEFKIVANVTQDNFMEPAIKGIGSLAVLRYCGTAVL